MQLKKLAITLAVALAIGISAPASAQYSGDTIKIGLLDDLSSQFSDYSGAGSVEAVKMAIEDAGGSINGKKIEFMSFDHMNKADLAANKAREWYDEQGMDMIMVLGSSAASLAAAKVAWEKKRFYITNSGAVSLTNQECSPYTVRWGIDTVVWSRGTGRAVVKQGGKTWFFVNIDNAFGASVEADASAVIKEGGGKILGVVKNPMGTSDFSSFMLQAKASKAQILGIANTGSDFYNAIKSANEFGLTKTMKIAGWFFVTDVNALGLPMMKNMYMTDSWYWDQSPASRAWSKRFFQRMKRMPTSQQATSYSSVLSYLASVKAAGTDDADKVMAKMKSTTFNDMYVKNGKVRPDGSMVRDVFLFQVKTPAESKYPWDYLKVVQTIPADQAFTTKAETQCQFWK
jgi:branched-chain amino acid transport system substrate-binding protein